MRDKLIAFGALLATIALGLYGGGAFAHDDEPEHGAAEGGGHMLEQMEEMHRGHDHAHNFEIMKEMSPEQMDRVMHLMTEIGLAMRPMNSERGRRLFLEKGCVICHSVNGVGGNVGPSLNAADMPAPMNAFEFAARMWRGAPAMVQMQEAVLGEIILLDGQELADIIAFAHDGAEQAELTKDQIPERYRAQVIE